MPKPKLHDYVKGNGDGIDKTGHCTNPLEGPSPALWLFLLARARLWRLWNVGRYAQHKVLRVVVQLLREYPLSATSRPH